MEMAFRLVFSRLTSVSIAALLLLGAAASGAADELTDERHRVEQQFAEDLESLARRCDELQLKREAELTRSWKVQRIPGRIYLFLPPPSAPEPPGEDVSNARTWFNHFLEIRRAHAERLFQLAKKSARQRPDWAYQLAHEVLREDPEHVNARQALGYRQIDKRWVYGGDAIKSSRGSGPLPEFGFASRQYYRIDSANFRILTNADEETGRQLAQRLEDLHCAWRQVFFEYWGSAALIAQRLEKGAPDARVRVDKHRVIWFANREQYLNALRDDEPLIDRTLGIYLDKRRSSFLYGDPAQNVTSWLHEVTHQLFAEYARTSSEVGAHGDMWLIEGVALFMESLRWQEDYCTIGGVDADRLQFARYRLLNDDFYVPLAELVPMDRQTIQRDERIGALYSQASGITHLLMTAEDGKFRPGLVRYLTGIYRERAVQSLEQRTGAAYEDLDRRYREFLQVKDEDLVGSYPISNLYLGHTDISDEGLRKVPVQNLEWLDLGFTKVSDDGLKHLENAERLKKLTLEHTSVTAASLEHLGRFRELEYLDLSGLPIDDASVESIAGLEKLESLWLTNTKITDEGLLKLAPLKNLTTLDVSGTRVTAEGLSRLRQLLPKLSE